MLFYVELMAGECWSDLFTSRSLECELIENSKHEYRGIETNYTYNACHPSTIAERTEVILVYHKYQKSFTSEFGGHICWELRYCLFVTFQLFF